MRSNDLSHPLRRSRCGELEIEEGFMEQLQSDGDL